MSQRELSPEAILKIGGYCGVVPTAAITEAMQIAYRLGLDAHVMKTTYKEPAIKEAKEEKPNG